MRTLKYLCVVLVLVLFSICVSIADSHVSKKQKWHEATKKDLALVVARTITGPAGQYSHVWHIGDMVYRSSVNYNVMSHGCSYFMLTVGRIHKDKTQDDAQRLLAKLFESRKFEDLPLESEENFYDYQVYGVCEKCLTFWRGDSFFFHRETAGSNVLGISSDEISDHFYSTSESNAMQDRYQANLHAIAQFIRDSEKP